MRDKNNFRELYATERLVVGHEWEDAYIIDKISGRTFPIGDFYGDPSCALISNDNTWCIVGGSRLILWTENEVFEFKDENLYHACELRQIDINTVEILIDPWCENSSIWELNVQSKETKKIRDFDEYRDKEYTDEIEW